MSVSLARLASLDLLRGFVAVGRRMSITLAARDLCLTQSAVSRQVLALETSLGVKLLRRSHRSISLTPDGERLFRCADVAIQQLQDTIATLRSAGQRPTVTITTSIGVAGLWLLPRLGAFQQQHPDIDLRVSASNRLGDLRSEGLDLAIRYCAPVDAPTGAIRLFSETIAPVAHPSLAVGVLRTPAQFRRHSLLEFDGVYRPWLQWGEWFAAQGWDNVPVKGTLRFNQYDQLIHAAVAGQGIALGRLALLGPMLCDGRLQVIPTLQGAVTASHAYWLICADAVPSAEVAQVIQWIHAEAAACQRSDRPGATSTEGVTHIV